MPFQRRVLVVFVMLGVISCRAMAARGGSRQLAFSSRLVNNQYATRLSSSTKGDLTETHELPIWNQPLEKKDARVSYKKVRQHVNPLARRYQQPTFLSPDWPKDVIDDLSLPLHLDIGCGRGGFLLEMAQENGKLWFVSVDCDCLDKCNERMPIRLLYCFFVIANQNYLGLEIRPPIFQYALDRVERRGLKGRLTFVGCNANVDLDRILTIYTNKGGGPVQTVSIQFPDPHFKSQHAKRRVVTPELVTTLAKHMRESSIVFLQSDIQEVLDDMRLRFREQDEYFQDEVEDTSEYLKQNPMGIQTERERSVLEKNLPVYRTILRRTAAQVPASNY